MAVEEDSEGRFQEGTKIWVAENGGLNVVITPDHFFGTMDYHKSVRGAYYTRDELRGIASMILQMIGDDTELKEEKTEITEEGKVDVEGISFQF